MPFTPVYGWPYQARTDAPNGALLGEQLALAIEQTMQERGIVGTPLLVTSDSATFTTTETLLATTSFPVVNGVMYEVFAKAHFQADTADLSVQASLRLGATTGSTRLASDSTTVTITTASPPYGVALHAIWTATSTGNQDFAVTAVRVSASGNARLRAGTTFPLLLFIRVAS